MIRLEFEFCLIRSGNTQEQSNTKAFRLLCFPFRANMLIKIDGMLAFKFCYLFYKNSTYKTA